MSIGLLIAIAVAACVALLVLRGRDERPSMPGAPDALGPDASVESLLLAGRKIDAIKAYRADHRVGLREAKEAVEALQRRIGAR